MTVQCDATLRESASLMDSGNVGALLVLDGPRLVGIVTDRDIVVRAVAGAYPPDSRIDSVMSTDIVAVDADADVHEAYRVLGSHGVRRLPVLDGDRIVGMIAVDDLLVGAGGRHRAAGPSRDRGAGLRSPSDPRARPALILGGAGTARWPCKAATVHAGVEAPGPPRPRRL